MLFIPKMLEDVEAHKETIFFLNSTTTQAPSLSIFTALNCTMKITVCGENSTSCKKNLNFYAVLLLIVNIRHNLIRAIRSPVLLIKLTMSGAETLFL